MSMKLYVGNLSYEISESELATIFQPFGEVASAKIVTDRYSGVSRGFGFVEMSTREEGEKAITELNGTTVRNRTIVVNEARPREGGGPGDRKTGRGGKRRF